MNMRIFELHFNPKLKEDLLFDSFVFEPSNSFERRLGSLYEVGELKNALPQNHRFLDGLAKAVKEKYYTLSNKNPEKAISESLKRANEFLEQEIKKDNVGWLGNLNFAVLSLKDSELIFTKTGDIKVVMIRAGILTDIGKSFEQEKIDPYPLKVFFNIVQGKLIENDIILILTKEIFEYFIRQKTIEKILAANSLDEKNIKEIFPENNDSEKEKPKHSGVCFVISNTKEFAKSSEKSKSIFSSKNKKIGLTEIFSPVADVFLWVKFRIKKLGIFHKQLPKKEEKNNKQEIARKIKVKSASSNIFTEKMNEANIRKGLVMALIFVVLLLVGFVIFRSAQEAKINSDAKIAEEKSKELQSKLITFSNPILFYELKLTDYEFMAKRILYSADNIFFYNPVFTDIYKLNFVEKKLEPVIKAEKSFTLAIADSGNIFTVSPQGVMDFFNNNVWQEKIIQFGQNANISEAVLYNSNVYILNSQNCKIFKLNIANAGLLVPQNWLKESLKNECGKIKSIAVDGSLWVLNGDNSIDVYFKGEYQKTIKADIYPIPENITKLETKAGVPYLYLLEPAKKRIIILDKEGKIFKQFQSEKFDSLTDFDISDNGKTIYLLNGNKVYSIEI